MMCIFRHWLTRQKMRTSVTRKEEKLLVQGWYLLSGINNQSEELYLEGKVVWGTRTGPKQAGTNLGTPGNSRASGAACCERRSWTER